MEITAWEHLSRFFLFCLCNVCSLSLSGLRSFRLLRIFYHHQFEIWFCETIACAYSSIVESLYWFPCAISTESKRTSCMSFLLLHLLVPSLCALCFYLASASMAMEWNSSSHRTGKRIFVFFNLSSLWWRRESELHSEGYRKFWLMQWLNSR